MHDVNTLEDQPIAWTPSGEVIERSRLMEFMRQIGISTWAELYQHSINDVEMFTAEVLRFLDIKFDPPYEKLLDMSNGVEFPKWFGRSADTPVRTDVASASEGDLAGGTGDADKGVRYPSAGLNITEMCLDRWQPAEPWNESTPAIIWEGEEGRIETYDYYELLEHVEPIAAGLRACGFGKSDAIGLHLPMTPETVIILLAIGRIGAIAVPVFSGYGVSAIEARLEAVQAKALFTSVGFPRRGKQFDSLAIGEKAASSVESIQKVFIVDRPRLLTESAIKEAPTLKVNEPKGTYDALHGLGLQHLNNFSTERTSAEDPLIILYTSGTTGKPKGIAHTHASFPIKAAQDMAFGTDVGVGTRICWYTDIGWMMGPWLIYGALINGATICIYDGAPDYPTPDRMWEFCAKHKVEILGISPTLVRALAAREDAGGSPPYEGGVDAASADGVVFSSGTTAPPHERHDLSSLRAFASTGEPWNPAPWWWLFEKVGNSKLPIINYSGGTEISGGILMGNPLLPIKPCSFPAPCPGMDVDILDEEGKPVQPGKVGELVIKQPWIGMARGFWQEKERYLETYWSRFKNIWVHGDWAMRDKDGHWFILGRSDDTLKIAGKRVGPAEIESILVSHPAVTEAAVIGVPDEAKGTAMVAFCVLGGGASLLPASANEDVSASAEAEPSKPLGLQKELRSLVATQMGKPLAPSKIHFVSTLPKTRNAKVMRRVIRSAYLGEDSGDLSALENPTVVEEIGDLKK